MSGSIPGWCTSRRFPAVCGLPRNRKKMQEALRALDAFEDCYAEDIAGSIYLRDTVQVETDRSRGILAWVYYLAHPPREEERVLIPGGDYEVYRSSDESAKDP